MTTEWTLKIENFGFMQHPKLFIAIRIWISNESKYNLQWDFSKPVPLLIDERDSKRVKVLVTNDNEQDLVLVGILINNNIPSTILLSAAII